MKVLKILKYLFTIIGLGFLIAVFLGYKSNNDFLKNSITTEGTVVKIVPSRVNNGMRDVPLIQFLDNKGTTVEFLATTRNNPVYYDLGEKVEVLYNPEASDNAKIKGFFSVWGGLFDLILIGAGFFVFGVVFFIIDFKKGLLLRNLKQNGITIESDFQNVKINDSFEMNGKNPYQIVSYWKNPATAESHIFTSNNIWFDPTEFIKTNKIKVLINPNNPKKYSVDLSFLPKKPNETLKSTDEKQDDKQDDKQKPSFWRDKVKIKIRWLALLYFGLM